MLTAFLTEYLTKCLTPHAPQPCNHERERARV